ncbi:MAG: VWA domain-containing protein [Bradymonadales bacterium]|nr:VWA domain-containing protein [Bradymonadales bacterium]
MLELDLTFHRDTVPAHSEVSQRLFLLVRLRTSASDSLPPPVNPVLLAVAVDTSGSMYTRLPSGTSKIERAIEAIVSIGTLQGTIQDTQLALIHFDHRAGVLLPLGPLGEEGPQRLASQAARLRNFGGGTNLAKALEVIGEEMTRDQDAGVKKAVVLTDGETTDAPECLEIASRLADQGISLICIGLGLEYNEDLLAELADRTNGFLYHLSDSDISLALLRQALADVILKSRREIVTDLSLLLHLVPQVSLVSINRVYPMVQALPLQTGIPWRLGNVELGSELDLVLEIDLPRLPVGLFSIGDLSASFFLPAQSGSRDQISRPIAVEVSQDPDRSERLNQEVIFFVRQARVSTLANQAVDQARNGRIEEARHSIQLMQRLTHQVGNEAIAQVARAAQLELARNATLGSQTIKAMKVGAKTKTLCAPPTKPGAV